MTAPAQAAAFADFAVTHNAEGLRNALAKLLKRTDFRFIGIWRFQSGKASAAVHFDRENPSVLFATEVPDTATYCCYVREAGAPFRTSSAMLDERLKQHSARSTVHAYCGVPLIGMQGDLLGTLCCYDLAPKDANQIDLDLMLMVANYLAIGGHVPPYPTLRA